MQEASQHQPAVSQPQSDHIPWAWVVGTAVGLEIAMIISAVVWVAIYSHLIHPGEDLAYYQNYAQSASPVVCIVLGIPYWFFACRWVGRKAGTRAIAMCLSAWLVLLIIDLPLIFLGQSEANTEQNQANIWSLVAIAHSTKLLAAYLGARAALKRATVRQFNAP